MESGGRGWAVLTRGLALLVLVVVGTDVRVEAAPGDLDPSFGTGGIVTTTLVEWDAYASVTELMQDAQGRIVAAGTSEAGGFLVRYLADGTLDASFGTNGVTVDNRLYWWLPPPFALAADGRIYAGGFADYEGRDSIILRFDADGRPDASFGTDGVRALDFEPSELVPVADGKLLIAGTCLVRMLPDGSYDPGFATSCWRGFRSIAFPTPGTIVAAGIDEQQGPPAIFRVTIGRFLADGFPDPAAGALPVTASPPLPFRPILVAVQPDGRIVAVDEGYEGVINLARVNLDGSLDATFGTDGVVTIMRPWGWGSWVGALAVQRDGRILVGGRAYVTDDDGYDFFVARFLPDGALDPSFGDAGIVVTDVARPPYGYQDVVYALLEDRDGRILAGGATHDGGDGGPIAVARYHGRPCGDGVVGGGEACDDGAANGTAGSCCTTDCTARVDGYACRTGNACVEGETCTAGACGGGTAVVCPTCDTCDPAIGCRFSPRVDCRGATPPVRARFRFRDPPNPNGRRLTFSWKAGEPLASTDVGDPFADGAYALCVYDEAEGSPRVRLAAEAPAGGICGHRPCWRRKGDRIDYRDPAAAPEGVTKIQVDAHRGTIVFAGRGPQLGSLPVPLGAATSAELRVRGGGCWRLPVPPSR